MLAEIIRPVKTPETARSDVPVLSLRFYPAGLTYTTFDGSF